MAHFHFAYPDLALHNFSCSDSDHDVESFIQLIERKINFSLCDASGDAEELGNYFFRKRTLFSFLVQGPTVE